jgi:exopolysaccharide biosynthesis WecB/TagA/CpsF family protein
MGVPKQELFAEQLIRTSNERVIICVGNFLEFYFGTKKRAPYFLQKIGFEWMFRLLSEPKRLWRRYLLGIPLFIYRVIKIKLGIKVI